MPRKPIDIPGQITYLAILDEAGKVDSQLMPDLPEELLCHMHRNASHHAIEPAL
jgi:hypothetical protein